MARIPRASEVTPRVRVTGVKREATGFVPPPPASYDEVGSQRSSTLRELVPDLRTRKQAMDTYKKMTRSDVSVKISLLAGKSPILGGDYYIDPFDESPEALLHAEFAEANLFRNINSPFITTLYEILRMFDYGSQALEEIWMNREWGPSKAAGSTKVYTCLHKLAPRPPQSLKEYIYDDNGGPNGLTQFALNAKNEVKEVEIPIEKLLIFTWDKDAGNLEGESILRAAYEPWYYKNTLYKIDAIAKERHGIGVPDIELPPGYSPTDKIIAHELGRNLRTNEYAYIVRTPGLKVGFAELKGQLVDALTSASHHDVQIMKNILMQFLNSDAQGGRATSATSLDIMLKTMRFVGNYICEVFNLYLMPRLISYNFDTQNYPSLKVRNIGETKDLQMWASAMGTLIDKNAITMDDDTEKYIRDVVDMPRKRGPRPVSTNGPSNVKEQYLLRDNPDTPANEDLAGQAAVDKAASDSGKGGGGTGRTSGNVGVSPSAG